MSIASAEDKEIGKVGDIAGGWCRKAARLKKADTLKLEDEVRYCSTPYSRQDYIVIDFPAKTVVTFTPGPISVLPLEFATSTQSCGWRAPIGSAVLWTKTESWT